MDEQKDNFYDTYNKDLYRTGTETSDDINSILQSNPNEDNSASVSVDPTDIGSGSGLGNNELAAGAFSGGKVAFADTNDGFWLGIDQGVAKFSIGSPSSFLSWDGSTLTVTGTLVATTGTIGGFSIGADYIRDTANSMGLASTVTGGDDVRFWAGDSFANRATAPFRVTEAGAVTGSSITITGGSVATSVLNGLVALANTNLAAQGWTQTCSFSASSATVVAWGAGTFTNAAGTSYSIGASNTGTMAARTYIYLDISISTTAYQVTTTATTAVGAGKVLVATAINNTTEAIFLVFSGAGQTNIDASSIVTGSITSNELGSASVTSAKGNLALRGWTTTTTFSSTSATQVDWTSGTFTASDGTAYSISSGNTGAMGAKTYIYLDIGTSTTAYQVTTTATSAVGDGKILIATAQNNTTESIFQVFGGPGGLNVDASNIVTGSITANEIAASTITGAKIAATTITASNIAANTITASQIAAGTITTTQIAATTIVAGNIAAGTITTTQIAALTIVAGNIAANTITAGKMNVSQLSAIAADLGSITAGSITINGGVASIDSAGAATFKSIQVGGSTRQYALNDNGIFSFGDASDGAATLDGTNTYGFMSLSGSTYTLTRDVYLSSLTVNGTTIAYDTTANATEVASASSISWSHTCTGSNLILVVTVGVNDLTLGSRTVSGITYNSVALTKIRSDDNGGQRRTEVWYLINPATGAHTVAVTMGGTCIGIAGASVSFSGAKQSAQADTSNGANTSGTATSSSVALTTTIDGDFIVDCLETQATSSAWVPGASQTSRYSLNGTNLDFQVSTRTTTGAGSYTNTWSWTTATTYATTAVAIKPLTAPVTLNMAGYRIFVRDTLTVNGTIQRNGNAGSTGGTGTVGGSAPSAGGSGGSGGGALADGYLKGALAGIGGATGGAGHFSISGDGAPTAGGSGSAGVNTTNSLGSAASNGGAGGASDAAAGSGGTGGTSTASNVKLIANWHLATLLDIGSTGTTIKFDNSASAAGGGGGGGGSSNTSGHGGGGGGGGGGAGSSGGIIAIYARVIVVGAQGIISCNGGNGGNGGVGGNGSGSTGSGGGGGGGGAGGNGGIVIVVYNSLTNSGSIVASAGTKGSGAAGGTGGHGSPFGTDGATGTAGSDGSAGVVYQFQLSL